MKAGEPFWHRQRLIFVDGEGVNYVRDDGTIGHRYALLSASDEDGKVLAEVEDWEEGLDARRCLDAIASLGNAERATNAFSFAFGYDRTKILESLDSRRVYLLHHPDDRARLREHGMPSALSYGDARVVNFLQGLTTVVVRGEFERVKRWAVRQRQTRVQVWDLFKFFQCSFVSALRTWGVASEEECEAIEAMKVRRSDFATVDREEIRKYCRAECVAGAKLARALLEAVEGAGVELRKFYSPGSVAEAMMTQWGAREKLAHPPDEVERAARCAYFGGRFELSKIGTVPGPVWSYDISSAYPYHQFSMPCLAHGRWFWVDGKTLDKRLGEYSLCCVKTRVRKYLGPWGALPFRFRDGTIAFPIRNPGVWVWQDEYAAAREFFAAEALEGWAYVAECDCKPPFAQIAEAYAARSALGKDGKGLAIKLGINSVYGKTVQRSGKGKFRSYVWGGAVTSGTRAQLLRAIAEEPAAVLMTATDGILSARRLPLATHRPTDTGTYLVRNSQGELAPLGGWEEERLEGGVHLIRPGIYFPVNPTEKEKKKVRSRGFGRAVLFANMPRILEEWEELGPHQLEFDVNVFVGGKHGVYHVKSENEYRRSPDYGCWRDQKRKVDYSPLPKRRSVADDGPLFRRPGPRGALDLLPWRDPEPMPRPYHGTKPGEESAPYRSGRLSKDARELERAREVDECQPDAEDSSAEPAE